MRTTLSSSRNHTRVRSNAEFEAFYHHPDMSNTEFEALFHQAASPSTTRRSSRPSTTRPQLPTPPSLSSMTGHNN